MLAGFQDFLKSNKIFEPSDILTVLKMVRPNFRFSYTTNKKTRYFNVPSAFDIETSSFFRLTGKKPEKTAIMYEWTFGLYGAVIIGREWCEFISMLETLSNELKLTDKKRLIIYVHNLAYEFQFMRKWFTWDKVFSIDNRKPIYAITTSGIEFRCSYLLSGYSLAKLGDELRTYQVKKLVGALDYEKIRHSKTPLTVTETAYCVNDVKVVMAYIAERMEQDGEISRIPLTKTGYVRNYCRNSCFYEPGVSRKKSFKRSKYMEIMKGLRLNPDEYKQLKRAFQGGFTHANPFYSGKVVSGVTSFDFTSSYPCVMVAEKFPMSSSECVEITSKEELNKNLKLYCCLFDVEFEGLQSRLWFDSYISLSRCWGVKKTVVNNGRVVSAAHLFTTVTEQDFKIIKQFYTWDHLKIGTFRRYKKDYLPTDFVKAILKLYEDKTTLKGVEGKEIEYLKSKEMLNSCYGMAVTDIVRSEIVYSNDDWQPPETPDFESAIKDYNSSRSRFLFYPWGVWVTAYARRNLFTGICEFASDYVYSDTDSVKVLNAENHMDYIRRYNETIRAQLVRAMDYHGLNHDAIEPETVEHVKKCLGVWDFDGHYNRFKTLGAKRYLVEYSHDERNSFKKRGTVALTVSGLSKKDAIFYLTNGWAFTIENKTEIRNPFERFNNELYIPPDYTGKNTHTYIDEQRSGTVVDYLGVPGKYDERSGVHLEKSDYSLKISREYLDYLLNIETIEI